ncbi:hypothetical protein [Streptomyces sp. NPDC048192]|uniref:hypothetical protein n=1 Tax=Streptomyces sp. NPDC048192 TaxID=3365510 RepID=UPI00371D8ECC
MPDTDRLYALSSTYNHPWLSDVDGPGLLIHDAVVAMRWYLTHEREENLAVAGQVSDDGGATWQALTPGELYADAERALTEQAQASGQEGRRAAAVLREAMAAEAADWLDHRIRYVQPDDPVQYRPATPGLAAWRRGGEIWALALDSVPGERVLTHLAGQYAAAQPEGPERLRTGARDTLHALALADDPADADVTALLGALRLFNRLTFGFETGQLKARAEQAQHKILSQLITRHPRTAAVARTHPDPRHPAQRAARAYLHRLSLLGPEAEERLLVDAAHDFTEALQAAEAADVARPPATAAADSAVPDAGSAEPAPEPIPGYPRLLEGDLQAAAAWRVISPAARRDADRAMAHVVSAATALAEASAAADPERPAGLEESRAMRLHTDRHQELEELTAQHALLMHAHVMADAETAAVAARHDAIVAAAQASEQMPAPRTSAEIVAGHEAFMASVNAAEDRIAHTLGTQRQITRDALHRLFPQHTGHSGVHHLRTQLIDRAGLGFAAYNAAWNAIGDTARTLESLEAAYRSNTVEFGRPPVTAEQVEQARTAAEDARPYFGDLKRSRALTLRAVKALDGAAGLEPSPSDSIAQRAARITQQSLKRAQQPETAAHGLPPVDRHQQAHSPQTQPTPGIRLP